MNVLSLFDGISCGKVALERAGIKIDSYFASEIDTNAIAISERNHKDIIQLGDVTKWREWNLPKIDLVIGGSPCQGFSRAGKCLNFDDPRSKLFFEYVDILNSIRKSNPDVLFLLENVKMKNEWKDVISEYLGVQPIEINSSLVSGQNRLRLYWTNIPGVQQPEDKGINLIDILECPGDLECVESGGINFDSTISEASRNLVKIVDGEIRISQTVKCGYIVAENGDGINLSFPTSKSRRGRVIKKKSSTVDCACNICVLQDGTIRRFTIRELERLQTLPDGYTDGFSRAIAQKAIGNGWTVDVVAHILSYIKEEKEKKEMELKINGMQLPGPISFNYEELKQEIAEKVSMYTTLVYTDEQIQEAKKDKAALNKLKKALNDERIRMEKEYMVPFNTFKAQINEIIGIIDKPVNLIDQQVKGYEEKQKQEKLEEIQEYWNNHGNENIAWVHFNAIFNEKWLNASVSMKSIQGEIDSRLEQITSDITTLQNLPEFGFEAMTVYKSSLDINKALNEGRRLAEIAKAKAAHEAEMKARAEEQARLDAEARKQVEEFEDDMRVQNEAILKGCEMAAKAPAKQWVTFAAHLTTEDALALKAFFEERKIEFKSV